MNDLEQQFLQLVKIVNNLQQRVITLEESNKSILQSNNNLSRLLSLTNLDIEYTRKNIYFEINDPRTTTNDYFYPIIESSETTIDEIVNNRKSLARFGDGEFATIAHVIRHKFQTVVDDCLAQRLTEVLNCEDDGLMIGMADHYGNLDMYTSSSQREIRTYLTPQIRSEHLALLKPDKKYYNAYITRPYIMYADNQTDAPALRFKNLKRIWDKRNCIFVEGYYTRLGYGNDLFDNANSIKRILGPAENAFSQYDQILETCLQQDKDVLFLIALGPTATVLAYDLFKAGYQAVDIGHIDMEYEWFLQGKGRRTQVKGKYNNESREEMILYPVEDEAYLSQIIADFSTKEF